MKVLSGELYPMTPTRLTPSEPMTLSLTSTLDGVVASNLGLLFRLNTPPGSKRHPRVREHVRLSVAWRIGGNCK